MLFPCFARPPETGLRGPWSVMLETYVLGALGGPWAVAPGPWAVGLSSALPGRRSALPGRAQRARSRAPGPVLPVRAQRVPGRGPWAAIHEVSAH